MEHSSNSPAQKHTHKHEHSRTHTKTKSRTHFLSRHFKSGDGIHEKKILSDRRIYRSRARSHLIHSNCDKIENKVQINVSRKKSENGWTMFGSFLIIVCVPSFVYGGMNWICAHFRFFPLKQTRFQLYSRIVLILLYVQFLHNPWMMHNLMYERANKPFGVSPKSPTDHKIAVTTTHFRTYYVGQTKSQSRHSLYLLVGFALNVAIDALRWLNFLVASNRL